MKLIIPHVLANLHLGGKAMVLFVFSVANLYLKKYLDMKDKNNMILPDSPRNILKKNE